MAGRNNIINIVAALIGQAAETYKMLETFEVGIQTGGNRGAFNRGN